MLAGVVYDTGDNAFEEERERDRIVAYYQAVINDAGQGDARFVYPVALHANEDPQHNKEVVSSVKAKIGETLSDFLQCGLYNGEQLTRYRRHGRYYVFAILKSSAGLRLSDPSSFDPFVRDGYAANLYFHMVDEYITHLLFHNPHLDQRAAIKCNFPSRVSRTLNDGERLSREFTCQRYQQENVDEGTHYYKITNPDIFRTLIANEITRTARFDKKIENFSVNAISYAEEQRPWQEFLYLSDTVCSYLSFGLSGRKPDDWLTEIDERLLQLIPKERAMLFGYDTIDAQFMTAWSAFETGDYYRALSLCHDATEQTGAFAEYYRRRWFPIIEQRMTEAPDPLAFKTAVHRLSESTRTDKTDQNKCLYIFERLAAVAEKIPLTRPGDQHILYTLYDTGMTAYSHVGNSEKARAYFAKAKQYAEYADVEEYLSTLNKVVVYDCDAFAFDEAKELADENASYHELLYDLKNETIRIDGKPMRDVNYAKALSQRGQVYAFRRDDEAEQQFKTALENCRDLSEADYGITLSYLLHFYIDRGRREDYLREAVTYFGNYTALEDQLDFVIKQNRARIKGAAQLPFNPDYALFVLIKGVYAFRMDEVNSDVRKQLLSAEKQFALKTHPAELIYKYLSLIFAQKEQKEEAEKFAGKMKTCLTNVGRTIEILTAYAEIEFESPGPERQKKARDLFCLLQQEFGLFRGEDPDDAERVEERLQNTITYMYH